MNFKKILLGSAIFAAGFGLIACGDDSSSGTDEDEISEDSQKEDDQKNDDQKDDSGESTKPESSTSDAISSSARCIEMVLDSAILANDPDVDDAIQSISLKTGKDFPKDLEFQVGENRAMFERSMLLSVYEADLSTGLKSGTLPKETPVCKSQFEINEDKEITSSRFDVSDGTWYIAKDNDNAIYPFFATNIKINKTEDMTVGQLKLYYYKKRELR